MRQNRHASILSRLIDVDTDLGRQWTAARRLLAVDTAHDGSADSARRECQAEADRVQDARSHVWAAIERLRVAPSSGDAQ